MKKTCLFLCTALIAISGIAQMNGKLATPGPSKLHKTFNNADVTKAKQNQSNNKTIQSYWLDYTDAYTNLYGGTPYGIIGNDLFPDSTILVDYGTSYEAPWIHGIGQIFDVDANAFKIANGNNYIDVSRSFTIDSLSAVGYYTRVDNSVTDTLVFQILEPSMQNLNNQDYFLNALGVDSAFFIEMYWDFGTISTPGVIAEYKVLLDNAFYADSTTNGFHIPTIGTAGDTITPANGIYAGVFSINMEFRPGYSYLPTDTLGVNKNAWWFGSNELNGNGTDPTYSKTDYNISYILPIECRYDFDPDWNGNFIPHTAFGTDYGYESMAINALISQDDLVSINELNNNSSFDVYPNPSAGVFNINLDANNNTMLTVRNVVGQTVINENVSGKSNHTISLADYSKGIYFLTIGEETVKLIVE